MTTAATAIAQHLNVAESLIAKIEEWAHVLFVRFIGRRPRFVSKRVINVMQGSEKQVSWANDLAVEFSECQQWSERLSGEVGSRDYFEMLLARVVVAHINRIGDAKWWIDHRNDLTIHNFKLRFKELAIELLPEWAIRECMVNAQWAPRRGQWLKIWDGASASV